MTHLHRTRNDLPAVTREKVIAILNQNLAESLDLQLQAARDGVGVTYMPEPLVAPYLAQGALVTILEEWSGTLPGVFLYYPSRRQLPVPRSISSISKTE